MELTEAKKQVIKAGIELSQSGLIARTWGNVSCRTDEEHFVITASGRNYLTLTEEEVIEVNMEDLFKMMDEAVAGIMMRGKSTTGEKTMLDSICPALEAMKAEYAASSDAKAALAAGVKAAEEGIEYTKTIAATKGRASYIGERSIGHQDPGATSFTMMLTIISDMA